MIVRCRKWGSFVEGKYGSDIYQCLNEDCKNKIRIKIDIKDVCDHVWKELPEKGRGIYVKCIKCLDRGPKSIMMKG